MIKKIRVSELEEAFSLKGLYSLGVETASGTNKSVKVSMSLLKGNTEFQEWQERNPGKTYEDWVAYMREPFTEVIEEGEKLHKEMKEAETERTEAEKNRIDAEEKRIENEIIRQENEKNRQENTAIAIKNAGDATLGAQSATADAKDATSAANKAKEDADQATEEARDATRKAHDAADRSVTLSNKRDYIGEDGFWYRYNEETKEFENTGKTSKGNLMYATFAYRDGRLYMRTDSEYTGPQFRMNNNGRLKVMI